MTEQAGDNLDEAEGCLRRRLGSRVLGLRVVVRDSRIVLRGRAVNYHAKQLAQHAAMELFRLPVLANEIEVRDCFSQTLDGG